MFESLYRLAERAQKLQPNAAFVAIVGEKTVQEYILDLNRFEQLFKESQDIEGEDLGRYSRVTENLNARNSFTYKGVTRRKTRGDNYFLFDSGRFFESFGLKVNNDGFSIVANEITDDGTNIILAFGNVIGLTNESKANLAVFTKPFLVEYAKRYLLGNA